MIILEKGIVIADKQQTVQNIDYSQNWIYLKRTQTGCFNSIPDLLEEKKSLVEYPKLFMEVHPTYLEIPEENFKLLSWEIIKDM